MLGIRHHVRARQLEKMARAAHDKGEMSIASSLYAEAAGCWSKAAVPWVYVAFIAAAVQIICAAARIFLILHGDGQ